MQKRKICMVGDFAVGKTSLTQRYVNNHFDDKYLTTIGVKIDSIVLQEMKLIIWDVAGRDSLSSINASYLVGAAGLVLVCDGCRPSTVDGLIDVWQLCQQQVPNVPVVVAVNKCDQPDWHITEQQQADFERRGWPIFHTSAKNDVDVSSLFNSLVGLIQA